MEGVETEMGRRRDGEETENERKRDGEGTEDSVCRRSEKFETNVSVVWNPGAETKPRSSSQ